MKRFWMRRKNKKGFTLMEVIVSLAVVGIITALILPLTASAMGSFNAAQSMRKTAATATTKMASTAYKNKSKEQMYVTVKFDSLNVKVESKLTFSKVTETGDYGVTITYTELEQMNVSGMGDKK